ncbi:MAG: sigma-54 interaction domain-containing protein [Planctomycetota bacterium]
MSVTDDKLMARRLELILDTMADGLFTVDEHGTITAWNRSMERLTGYAADEALGERCRLLACDLCLDGPCAGEGGGCCLFAEGAVNGVKCHVRGKDGGSIPVLKNARVMYDDEGEAVGAVETLTDLTAVEKAERRAAEAQSQLADLHSLDAIVGRSEPMQELYRLIEQAAASEAAVLITGETGTGKELVASSIHYRSARKREPFVKVNCSALSEGLLESELFGHVQGAFTGAHEDKVGRFEAADGGTLFLDEVGDLSPTVQLKLLRVLEEHQFERVGESQPRQVDVRVIAATHRDLRERMRAEAFRRDLYYRLKVFTIHVPPLRERPEDIPLLVEHFIRRFNEQTGKAIEGLDADARRAVMDHCWPGNVRELEHAIEHAFVTCEGGLIGLFDLPVDLRKADLRREVCEEERVQEIASEASPRRRRKPGTTREDLLRVLDACDWNKAEAARQLGVARTTVWRRIKRFGLDQLREGD